MEEKIAPEGKVYVCLACGKTSKDKYGDIEASYGWDISCILNSKMFDKSWLEYKDGKVVKIIEPDNNKA